MSSQNKKYFSQKKPGKAKAFFICLIIAAFLWLFHSLNTVYTYTFKIPVEFKNIPPNKKPLMELPEFLNVDVKASGLKLSLIKMNKSLSPVEVDFNNLHSINKNKNYVLSAPGLDFKRIFHFETHIKRINPDTLYFAEKTSFQKNVPVKVPLQIKCAQGYACKKPVITPNFISIYGDTNLIQGIDTVYTQALTLNRVNQNVNDKLELIKLNPNIYTNVNSATIFIEVARLIEHSLYVPVSDIHQSDKEQVNIFPSKVRVRFTSIQNSFHNEDSLLFKATVNSEKTNPLTKKNFVSLSLIPENVNILSIEPQEVEVLILKKK